MCEPHRPTIAILMPVLNGARYLPEQLDSLLAQTDTSWEVLVSDDGSSDATRDILNDFAVAHPLKIKIFDGPGEGSCANMLSLLARVDPATQLVAFCDQDDVWDTDRLARAMTVIGVTDRPTLYCSRTRLVAPNRRLMCLSARRRRPPSFQNALVQNIASGNTMVLNAAGWKLLADQIASARAVLHHDWWAYQLISGVGGRVIHDDQPTLDYRQHAANLIGAQTGFAGARNRLGRVVWRTVAGDVGAHLAALIRMQHCLTAQNRQRLQMVMQTRKAGFLQRLGGLLRAGVYRQSRLGTFGLWAATIVGRI